MSNARFSIIQARSSGDKRLTDSQLRTLVALGKYGDREGWCWPSQTTLAEDLGKSRDRVNRDIAALEKLGYIEKHKRKRKDGTWNSCMYRLLFDKPYDDADHMLPNDTWASDHVSPDDIDHVSPDDTLTSQVNVPLKKDSENDSYTQSGDEGEALLDFQKVVRALEVMAGGGLNSSAARYVDTWLSKHKLAWVLKAIELTKERGVTALSYVDKILMGWEANGYPKPREEQVASLRSKTRPVAASARENKSLSLEEVAAAKARRAAEQSRAGPP